jgi:CHAT domain-containing protein
MFTAPVLLLALLSDPSAELNTAFGARDIGRLMRLWDAASPTLAADRKRLTQLALDDVDLTADGNRLDITDAAGTSLEQYELVLKDDRVWSLRQLQPASSLASAREQLHRGTDHFDAGELDAAIAAFARAAELADASGHAPTRAAAQRSLGAVAATRGDSPGAACHYELALAIARTAGNRHWEGRILDALAEVDRASGQVVRAEARAAEALKLFRAGGNRLAEGWALISLGVVHILRSEYDESYDRLMEAAAIFERFGDPHGTAASLNALGVRDRARGAYAEATVTLRRALELYRSVGNLSGIGTAQGNLAVSLSMQGQYAEALVSFREALATHERIGRFHAIMVSAGNTGEMYRALGDHEQAREYFQRALVMAGQAGYKPGAAVMLHNLGQIRLGEDDPRGAIELYEKALALEEETGNRYAVGRNLHNLGRAYRELGDLPTARSHFERSLAIAEELQNYEAMVISLAHLADVSERPERALELARRVFTAAEATSAPELLWSARLSLGRAYRRTGQLDAARAEIERSVAIVEDVRRSVPGEEIERQQAFANMVLPYQEMVGVLVEQRDVAGALEYAERAKARALLEVLRNGRLDLGSALGEGDRARENALAMQLAQVNREYRDALVRGKTGPELLARVRTARLEYERFLDAVFATRPQLRRERGEIRPARASDASALLAAGAADAFLEFVVTDERTYLFALSTNGGVRVHTIPAGRLKLKEEVRRFRELLGSHDLVYGKAARALYDLLLAPAAAQLRGQRTICVIPDGPLWELPFQALQPSAAEFLLDRHAVYYAPSLTVLRETRDAAAPHAGGVRLLAFGNPIVPRETPGRPVRVSRDAWLAPLPHSETEIRSIAALYGRSNSRVHVRGEAREEVVKAEAGGFDVLHFATHGVLDDQNALYSRLVLSPPAAPGEDGLLEAREIMHLDLNARLAVLSACETARGHVGAGEGLIGLSWALFVAGVPTTVVSQWSVDSASTAELMIEFHRNLRVPGRSTAEALRLAALATRSKAAYRHPFYWAPFVVVGSAR